MTAVDVTGLAPPIQKMLRALSVGYNNQDVNLLREASTHDMVKLYSAMASGTSADDLWNELRGSLKKRLGEDFGKPTKVYKNLEIKLTYIGEPIGIDSELHGRHLVVTHIVSNSPSDRAGVVRGHVIKYANENVIKEEIDLINQVNTLQTSGGMVLNLKVKSKLFELPEEVEPEIEEQEEDNIEESSPDELPVEDVPTEDCINEVTPTEVETSPPAPELPEVEAKPNKKPEIKIIMPISEKIKEELADKQTNNNTTNTTERSETHECETEVIEVNKSREDPQTEVVNHDDPQVVENDILEQQQQLDEDPADYRRKEKKSKKDKKKKKKAKEEKEKYEEEEQQQQQEDQPQPDENENEQTETSESPRKKEKRKKDKKKYRIVPQTDPFGNTFNLKVPLSEEEEDDQLQDVAIETLSREPTTEEEREHPLAITENSQPPSSTVVSSRKLKVKKEEQTLQESGIEMRGSGESPEPEESDDGCQTATPTDSPLGIVEDGDLITITEPTVTVKKIRKKKIKSMTEDDKIPTDSQIEMEHNKHSDDEIQTEEQIDPTESEPEAADENYERVSNTSEQFDPLQGPLTQERTDSPTEEETRFHDDKTANNSFFELSNNNADEVTPDKTIFTITDVESVSVPEYATRNDVTVFSVTVVGKDFSRKIWRRYTAFSDLKNCYSQLSRFLPPFPKKHLLGLNQQKLESRRAQLGVFLSSLVSVVQKRSAAVARPIEAFLELNNFKLTHSALAQTQMIPQTNDSFIQERRPRVGSDPGL